MKNIKILLCCLPLLLMWGCNGKLDELRPHNKLEEESYLQSIQNLVNATSGAYALMHAQTGGFGISNTYYLSYYSISELSGNNGVFAEPFEGREGLPPADAHFHLLSYGLPDSYAGVVWVKMNQIMLYATKNIIAADKLLVDPLMTDADKANILRLRGENYFLRGVMAHNAMNVFARPYWDEPSQNLGIPFDLSGQGELVARSTVADSYEQIVSDFKNAAADLPDELSNRTYANKPAAFAYLSRVYLNMGGLPTQPNDEYNQLAVDYADDVFSVVNDVVDLERGEDYRLMFDNPATSKELLFSFWLMNMSDISNLIARLYTWTGYESSSGSAVMPVVVSQDYMDIMDTDADLRWQYFYELSPKHTGRYTTNKFSRLKADDGDGYYIAGAAVPYIRVAEVILNRAEAHAKLGNTDEALADLNEIRTRAGLDELSDLSGDALFDEIFRERRRELAFEGHTYYDYVRNGIKMERTETTTVYPNYTGSQYNEVDPRNSRRTMWPVPAEEISLNPKLVQNEY